MSQAGKSFGDKVSIDGFRLIKSQHRLYGKLETNISHSNTDELIVLISKIDFVSSMVLITQLRW